MPVLNISYPTGRLDAKTDRVQLARNPPGDASLAARARRQRRIDRVDRHEIAQKSNSGIGDDRHAGIIDA